MSVRQQVLRLLDYPDATYVEIGSIVGCSRQRVQQIAKSAGLTRNRRPHHYRGDVTVERVLNLYHNKLLIKEIAQTLGCNQVTVRSRLRQAGASSSEHYLRGWKRRKQESVPLGKRPK